MRVFVFIWQFALSHKDLTQKLIELENLYNQLFKDVFEAINYLMQRDKLEIEQKETKTYRF
ncbi:MAG: hypothetical protein ACTHK0_17055 [Ginsengibacter sp.]